MKHVDVSFLLVPSHSLEVIANRLEPMALRLEAIPVRLEAIAIRFLLLLGAKAIAVRFLLPFGFLTVKAHHPRHRRLRRLLRRQLRRQLPSPHARSCRRRRSRSVGTWPVGRMCRTESQGGQWMGGTQQPVFDWLSTRLKQV